MIQKKVENLLKTLTYGYSSEGGAIKNDHVSHIVSLANQNLKKGYLQKKRISLGFLSQYLIVFSRRTWI